MRVREHLLVPCLRREARVEEEARGRDEHDLGADLVRSIHELVVDRGVAGTLTLRFFLIGGLPMTTSNFLAISVVSSISSTIARAPRW